MTDEGSKDCEVGYGRPPKATRFTPGKSGNPRARPKGSRSVGATLIAADKTGRVCRGVELDSLYVDVIVRRYEAATGGPAVLIETGEAFDLLAARRSGEAAPV